MLSRETIDEIASAELRDPRPAVFEYPGVYAAVANGYDETAGDRPVLLIDAESGETTRYVDTDLHSAVAEWQADRT